MRRIALLLAVLLPCPIRLMFYRVFFGWKIGRRVHVGLSYLDGRDVQIGENVHIGHLNNFRKLNQLHIGPGTWISNMNSFFGCRDASQYPSNVSIGRTCYIMSRHFVDVTGTVEIGDRVTLAGRETHIWSHSLKASPVGDTMEPAVAKIGDGAYIGARSTIVLCAIPSGAMVGAGSVVTKSYPPEANRLLLAGNPAVIKKRYEATQAAQKTPTPGSEPEGEDHPS